MTEVTYHLAEVAEQINIKKKPFSTPPTQLTVSRVEEQSPQWLSVLALPRALISSFLQ